MSHDTKTKGCLHVWLMKLLYNQNSLACTCLGAMPVRKGYRIVWSLRTCRVGVTDRKVKWLCTTDTAACLEDTHVSTPFQFWEISWKSEKEKQNCQGKQRSDSVFHTVPGLDPQRSDLSVVFVRPFGRNGSQTRQSASWGKVWWILGLGTNRNMKSIRDVQRTAASWKSEDPN